MQAAPTERQLKPNSSRIHYLALGTLAAAVVVFAVYSNQATADAVRSSVSSHHAFATTMAACDAVASAGEVNRPGNDVFLTGDVAAARASVASRMAAYRAQSEECRSRLMM